MVKFKRRRDEEEDYEDYEDDDEEEDDDEDYDDAGTSITRKIIYGICGIGAIALFITIYIMSSNNSKEDVKEVVTNEVVEKPIESISQIEEESVLELPSIEDVSQVSSKIEVISEVTSEVTSMTKPKREDYKKVARAILERPKEAVEGDQYKALQKALTEGYSKIEDLKKAPREIILPHMDLTQKSMFGIIKTASLIGFEYEPKSLEVFKSNNDGVLQFVYTMYNARENRELGFAGNYVVASNTIQVVAMKGKMPSAGSFGQSPDKKEAVSKEKVSEKKDDKK